MNLHRRLTIAMAVLLVIGLAVADVVTYSSLRSFLYGRLDAQIDSSQSLAARYLLYAPHHGHSASDEGLDERVGPDVYVLVLGHDGKVVLSRPSGSPDRPNPQPVIPKSLRTQAYLAAHAYGPVYRPNPNGFDMAGPRGSGAHYRAQAVSVPQGTLIIAISLNATTETLASLLRVELVASLAVVVALCILALWTVRRGLRPLDDMSRTAGAIASGDLTRRVPRQRTTPPRWADWGWR